MAEDVIAAGTRIAQYEVVRQVGRGGMGTVYEARDLTLGRRAALKVLPTAQADTPESVQRFLREARAAAALNHPNILHVYGVGQAAGVYYIAMEYAEGQPLHAVIAARGQLPLQHALAIARDVAEALGAAHDAGIVHRDIKPHNIIVDRHGRAKVMDFGLAKALADRTAITQDGAPVGTPLYMSPEQCEGSSVDGRSDLYSLGVALFEMLTGSPPYAPGDTPLSLLYQIVHKPFPGLGGTSPAVPECVRPVLARLVAKHPDERYADAQALIRAIDACASATLTPPVQGRTPVPPSGAPRSGGAVDEAAPAASPLPVYAWAVIVAVLMLAALLVPVWAVFLR
ncbi:MAG: serine/threonine protein kinase [bacterium]|nr:serine/threonine protein kinase [bacterium]